ncbi:unnamed protein product [Vitrella brassicaformis CCMP3155]|uniref:Mpv17-like protein n=2 Tax=Vitrella brassicaformis TaxID=1169539 RepID=A0A0G4EXC9_VITBC|nr:unnamed protein product [Vitrella brassicaformis CCMP3155]|eukprot:CEM03336.1 unnamed protein product [Vitrella brassicaformis CCMP3155]
MRGFFGWYKRNYDKHPYVMAFCTCAIKASASDCLAQMVVEKNDKFDVGRNLKFTLWGAVQTGAIQHWAYNVVFTRMYGTSTTLVNALKKTLTECFVYIPLLYMPNYYLFKAVLNGKSVTDGVQMYCDEIGGVIPRYAMIWIPANFINFGPLMPMQFRIAFAASVSFCWSILLSCLSPMNKLEQEDTNKAETTTTATTSSDTPPSSPSPSPSSPPPTPSLHLPRVESIQIETPAGRPITAAVGAREDKDVSTITVLQTAGAVTDTPAADKQGEKDRAASSPPSSPSSPSLSPPAITECSAKEEASRALPVVAAEREREGEGEECRGKTHGDV